MRVYIAILLFFPYFLFFLTLEPLTCVTGSFMASYNKLKLYIFFKGIITIITHYHHDWITLDKPLTGNVMWFVIHCWDASG